MTAQNKATIKDYFKTGDTPTQAQFADLIDSYQDYDVNTAKTDVEQEYTKSQGFNMTTLSYASGISWDLADNQVAELTLTGNATLNNPTNQNAGSTYLLIVRQDGSGNRTLSYGSDYKWSEGSSPTLTTAASGVDILSFVSDGNSMYGSANYNFS
jgi:hypothetical protein